MSGHLSKPDDWKKIPKRILNTGIKIEMEHTTSRKVARRIASDHFAEFGKEYYPALVKMEEKLERDKKRTMHNMKKL